MAVVRKFRTEVLMLFEKAEQHTVHRFRSCPSGAIEEMLLSDNTK
jgi:hypothetical protein